MKPLSQKELNAWEQSVNPNPIALVKEIKPSKKMTVKLSNEDGDRLEITSDAKTVSNEVSGHVQSNSIGTTL